MARWTGHTAGVSKGKPPRGSADGDATDGQSSQRRWNPWLYGVWPIPDAPSVPVRKLTVGGKIAMIIVDLVIVGGLIAGIWFLASR